MLLFLDSEVHLQCNIIQCAGKCLEEDDCSSIAVAGVGFTRSFPDHKIGSNEESAGLAGTTVYVIDPEKASCMYAKHLHLINSTPTN